MIGLEDASVEDRAGQLHALQPRGQGLARDMRVRWALEDLAVAYDVQLLSFA